MKTPSSSRKSLLIVVLAIVTALLVSFAGGIALAAEETDPDAAAPAEQQADDIALENPDESATPEEGFAELAAAPAQSNAGDEEDLAKNGSLVISSTITDSWEGDDRAFEIWLEIGDCDRYGELPFTITAKDGTTRTYVLNPDVDEMEDIDCLTSKNVVVPEGFTHRNAFYTFLLKDGEVATITGIPERAHYQCYVASSGAGFYGTGYNGQYENVYNSVMTGGTSGSFYRGSTYYPAAVHRRYAVYRPVVKVLLNNHGEQMSFPFRLTLLEEDGVTPISGFNLGRDLDGKPLVTDENGVAEFYLSSSRSLTLPLPANANYDIEELWEDTDQISLFEVPEYSSGQAVVSTIGRPCIFFNIEKYEFEFEKQDEEGFLVPGALLQILDDKGEVVAEWTSDGSASEKVWLDLTTGGSSFGMPSSYVLHEAEAPDGYEAADDISFKVVLTEDGTEAKIKLEDGTLLDKLVLVDTDTERSVSVSKVWDDKDDQAKARPDEVKVQLLADGEACGDPVVLSADNQWQHTWEGLDWHSKGREIVYTVEEVSTAEGYTATVGGDVESGFVITNTYAEDVPEKDDAPRDEKPQADRKAAVPETGDESSLHALVLLSTLGAGALLASRAVRER